MGTRYLWDQYYIKNVYGLQRSTAIGTSYTFPYSGQSQGARGKQVAFCGDYYDVRKVNEDLIPIAMSSLTPSTMLGQAVFVETDTGIQTSSASYKYLSPDSTGNYSYYSEILVPEDDNDGAFWNTYLSGNTVRVVRNSILTGEPPVASKRFYAAKPFIESQEKGNYKDLVSNSNSSKYSNNGITGNYWYVYKGSDSIDPSAVTYSKQDLYPEEPVTISVAPVTPTYGGTVSYLYQYSVNGGSTWTTIGSKTTDTSVTVTIPEGATQFQARVTASDGWGFTSTTPVLGPSLGVSQLKAYAAVGGKLRSGVKMYATVNGKIREIQKGYATIGGKIRKMF